MGGFGPSADHLTTVYTVYYQGQPVTPFSADIHDFLTHKVAQWQRIEAVQWAQIGWRDWAVTRYPDETPPGPEMAGVGRSSSGDHCGTDDGQ